MTAEEKFIKCLRDSLIEKYGDEFTALSDEEQNELLLSTFQKLIKKAKSEK